jgi:prefoldin subunit 5
MFNPIKAAKTEINQNVAALRTIIAEYRYEKTILESQAKLAETTLVPGYTKIYA